MYLLVRSVLAVLSFDALVLSLQASCQQGVEGAGYLYKLYEKLAAF